MARIILHLKPGDVGQDLRGWHLALYREIRALCAEVGIGVEERVRDADLTVGTRRVTDGRFDDGNLHILDDRSLRAANVLNAAVAYLWGFWHLDPCGTKAFSSIGAAAYDPADMPFRRAKPFYQGLQRDWARARRSKYDQTVAELPVPRGAVAVFLQGDHPRASGAAHCDDLQMLRAVLREAGDRPVLVKPHPLLAEGPDLADVRALARGDDRVQVTTANVHDILAQAAVSVSMNSTVALEGFLHRTPAILFGRADFHHFTGQASPEGGFADVLAREEARTGGYAQYLAWYFLRHCLRPQTPGFRAALIARLTAPGLPRLPGLAG